MRRITKIIALTAAALSFGMGVRADMQPGTAVVRELEGSGTYVTGGGVEKPLAVGVVLKEGDTVKTSADSWLNLLLPQNGPDVGLGPQSTLRFTKLQYEETELGVVKQTVLDVPEGQIYGHVDTLVGDSKYLVRSPKGIAEVKGTDFYYDTKTGDIHVITGQVFLTIIFNVTQVTTIPPFAGNPADESFAKAVVINAGQSFFMPRGQAKEAVLTAVTTPGGIAPPPPFVTWFTQYTSGSPTGLVTTRYDTTLNINPFTQSTKAVVKFPPTLVTVSP
jgi:hypothetical protein